MKGIESEEFYQFLNGPYKLLSKENVIMIYTPENTDFYFPEANNVELSIDNIKAEEDGQKQVVLELKNDEMNSVTNAMLTSVHPKNLGRQASVNDLMRATLVYGVAETAHIPIITNKPYISHSVNNTRKQIEMFSNKLAIMTLEKFAVPQLFARNYEDIIVARESLKDELLEYKASILELTYLLCKNAQPLELFDLHLECTLLIDTKIKASIMRLEESIRQHRKSKIRNLVVNGGKILLSGGNVLIAGEGLKHIIENGLNLIDATNNLLDCNIPENRIASFVYKANNILK